MVKVVKVAKKVIGFLRCFRLRGSEGGAAKQHSSKAAQGTGGGREGVLEVAKSEQGERGHGVVKGLRGFCARDLEEGGCCKWRWGRDLWLGTGVEGCGSNERLRGLMSALGGVDERLREEQRGAAEWVGGAVVERGRGWGAWSGRGGRVDGLGMGPLPDGVQASGRGAVRQGGEAA
jgi:hypothetical protein